MTRALVTGGSGFMGCNLVRALHERGDGVVNVDVVAPRDPATRSLWHPLDILDRAALVRWMREWEPEQVYHLAARTDLQGRTPAEYPANTRGVRNVIDAAGRAGSVRRILFASSRLVCRIGYQPTGPDDYCPTTAYGESKVEGERLVYRLAPDDVTWCIVRPTSIWGPWFATPYRDFFDAVARGRYLHPRGHRVEKSFGYVGNAVYQLLALARAPAHAVHGRMFYCADYEPIELLDWARRIQSELRAPPVREVPWPLLKLAALGGDALGLIDIPFPLTSFRLDNMVTPMVHDIEPLRRIVGDLPFDLATGIGDTVAWMRSQPD